MLTRDEVSARQAAYEAERWSLRRVLPFVRLTLVLVSGALVAYKLIVVGRPVLGMGAMLLTCLVAVPAYAWKSRASRASLEASHAPQCPHCGDKFDATLAIGAGRCSECAEPIVGDAAEAVRRATGRAIVAAVGKDEFARRVAAWRRRATVWSFVWIATMASALGLVAVLDHWLVPLLPIAWRHAAESALGLTLCGAFTVTGVSSLVWLPRLRSPFEVECPHCRGSLHDPHDGTDSISGGGAAWTLATNHCWRCGSLVFDADSPGANAAAGSRPHRDFARRLAAYIPERRRLEIRGVDSFLIGSLLLIPLLFLPLADGPKFALFGFGFVAVMIVCGRRAWGVANELKQLLDVSCPACGKPLDRNARLVVATGRCAHCGTNVLVDEDDANPLDPPEKPAPASCAP